MGVGTPRLLNHLAALVANPKNPVYDYFVHSANAAAASLAIELVRSPVENAMTILKVESIDLKRLVVIRPPMDCGVDGSSCPHAEPGNRRHGRSSIACTMPSHSP
jgi:hypothetical protein